MASSTSITGSQHDRIGVFDPHGAIQLAFRLPQGEEQNHAVALVLQTWARKDPGAAAQRALQMPEGDERDSALSSVASWWAEKDPNAAAQLAFQIPEGATRYSTLGAATEHHGTSTRATTMLIRETTRSFAEMAAGMNPLEIALLNIGHVEHAFESFGAVAKEAFRFLTSGPASSSRWSRPSPPWPTWRRPTNAP